MKDKAILVIDMPEGCNKCEFGLHQDVNINYCKVSEKHKYKDDIKPDWCPLQPMPEKYDIPDSDFEYELGFNKCIDWILGRY